MKTKSSKEYKEEVLDLIFLLNEGKIGLYEVGNRIIKTIQELSSRIKRVDSYYRNACERNNTLRSNIWFKEQTIKELKKRNS